MTRQEKLERVRILASVLVAGLYFEALELLEGSREMRRLKAEAQEHGFTVEVGPRIKLSCATDPHYPDEKASKRLTRKDRAWLQDQGIGT